MTPLSNFYSSFDTSCSNFSFVSSFDYSDVIASQTFTHRSIHLVPTFRSFPHLITPTYIASQTFTHLSIHLVPTFRSFPHLITPTYIASQTFTHRSIHLVPTFRSFPHLITPM